ncbi:MAG: sporulation protein YqfD [Epulopiscium sp. Nele67-Bin001]|nr:MAG: sporulation protein YqfD [Epulopiscium sp. Nuni2H_MBin001]OON92558.1 MAG: sporulation protein YqfD [Epulopiscium sp. Nele67-Bin001]
MFVYLWNYLRGYVIVEISGLKIEKFLNGALKEGNNFWDVRQDGEKVTLKTTRDGFKNLKPMANRSKCQVRIIDKVGLPFLAFRYRKRKMLLAGAGIFIGLVWFLTSFVWLVEVDGNNLLEETDIIATLKDGGYTTGKMKWDMNLREAEQYLINEHPEILWAGISYQGTKLNVQITEAVPRPVIHNETDATDIVANRDGIITYIATSKGLPLVRKGDTVKKGDVLVAGAVPLDSDIVTSVAYVNAEAEILAQTLYVLEASAPLDIAVKNYIDSEIKTTHSIKIFDKQFNVLKASAPAGEYDTLVTIDQFKLTQSYPLPFYYIKTEQVPYTAENITQEQSVVEDKLEGALNDALLEKIGASGNIVRKEIVYNVIDGTVVGILHAVVEEDISEEVLLAPPQQNELEGVEVDGSN